MKYALSSILSLAVSAIGYSFGVNPMVAEFDLNAASSQQVFTLENRSDTDVPIEIVVAKPTLGEDGIERLEEGNGEDLFLILPQQLVLPANSKRSVKALYVGDPMDREDTYRILFKELPVDIETPEDELAPGESSFTMKVVMQYHTRIWLTPKGLEENLNITDFKKVSIQAPKTKYADGTVSEDSRDLDMLELTVANDGQKHGYIRYPTITMVRNSGKPIVLSRKEVENVSGQVVLKNSSKTFRIPWTERFPELASVNEIRLETIRR